MVRPNLKIIENNSYTPIFVLIASHTNDQPISEDMKRKDYYEKGTEWDEGITTQQIKDSINSWSEIFVTENSNNYLSKFQKNKHLESYSNRILRMIKHRLVQREETPVHKNKRKYVIRPEFVVETILLVLKSNPFTRKGHLSLYCQKTGRPNLLNDDIFSKFHQFLYQYFLSYIRTNFSYLTFYFFDLGKTKPHDDIVRQGDFMLGLTIKELFYRFLIHLYIDSIKYPTRHHERQKYLENPFIQEFYSELDYFYKYHFENPFVDALRSC